jgi:phage terminase large subunit
MGKRRGNSLVEKTDIRKGYDMMQVAGWVKSQWDACLPSDRPTEILVDSIGIGAGVLDRLMELGLPARGINVSESAAMTDLYTNLRTELWFKGREWFEKKDSNLLGDELLAAELRGPRYKYASTGKKQVESKDDMKKRGVQSPNRADAFLLTLASENVAASGGAARASWNEPLKFKLAGLV